MTEIFMRESQIFSRQFKPEDIAKIIQFEEGKNNLLKPNDFGEEISHGEKINLDEYKDLTDEFNKIIIQKDIDLLGNDIQRILDYFHFGEIIINQYISDKYKNDNNKRHLNIRLADYLLRVQFEQNESINEAAKKINEQINTINESYNEINNLKDLSDKTYIDKIQRALNNKYIPLFLLREGYRIRRLIEKNKRDFEKELHHQNNDIKFYLDDARTNFSENDNDYLR